MTTQTADRITIDAEGNVAAVVSTKTKSNSVITHRVEGSMVIFTVKDAGELVLDMGKLHEANVQRALVHGMVQRVSDSAAIPFNKLTGKYASPAEKFAAMSELVEHYNSGSDQWRLARAGDGVGRSFLLNALCSIYADKSREELGAWLKSRSDLERKALENSPSIKPLIDKQRSQGAEKVDTDSLLAELG